MGKGEGKSSQLSRFVFEIDFRVEETITNLLDGSLVNTSTLYEKGRSVKEKESRWWRDGKIEGGGRSTNLEDLLERAMGKLGQYISLYEWESGERERTM